MDEENKDNEIPKIEDPPKEDIKPQKGEGMYYTFKTINLIIVVACLVFALSYLVYNMEVFKKNPLQFIESKLGPSYKCTCSNGVIVYTANESKLVYSNTNLNYNTNETIDLLKNFTI